MFTTRVFLMVMQNLNHNIWGGHYYKFWTCSQSHCVYTVKYIQINYGQDTELKIHKLGSYFGLNFVWWLENNKMWQTLYVKSVWKPKIVDKTKLELLEGWLPEAI